MDGDGDKKEPMKKAIKEKGDKKDVKEGSMPPWLKDKKDDKKSDKKDDDTCSKCGGDHDDKDHDKKDDKKDVKEGYLTTSPSPYQVWKGSARHRNQEAVNKASTQPSVEGC